MSTPDDRAPRPALPSEPPLVPTEEEQRDAREWDRFTALATEEIATSATRWKDGLVSLAGAAAAGLLVIKVPDASSIDAGWRLAVIGIVVVATAAGLLGLWCALSATAGTPAVITQKKFKDKYVTVDAFVRARGRRAVALVTAARWAALISVVAAVVGAVVLWLAPTAAPSLRVTTADAAYCGTVTSADHGEIHLKVAGERDSRVVPLTDVTNLSVVKSC